MLNALHMGWISTAPRMASDMEGRILYQNPETQTMQVRNALHMGWVEYCAALRTAQRMAGDMEGRTLVVHNGDVSYAEGNVYGWDVFMHMMGPVISRAPYMLSPGTHP